MTNRVGLFLLAFAPLAAGAQTTSRTPEPAFEVASIREVNGNSGKSYFQFQPTGTVTLINVTLSQIITRAYEIDFQLQRFTLVPGRREVEKLLSARFEIRAKAPEGSSRDEQLAMLRTLLADRFTLVTHTEMRPTPIYALTIARRGRLGPDIRRTTHDCTSVRDARRRRQDVEEPRDVYGQEICVRQEEYNTPKRGAYRLRDAGPFSVLVERLKGFVDRPLVDETGLTGNFDWVVAFSNDPVETELPSVAQAVEDRLGLKLEPRIAPLSVRVIDSVAMPTPN